MNKSLIPFLILLVSIKICSAQQVAVKIEPWSSKPAIHTFDAKYNKESAVVIKDVRRVEYIDNAKGEVEKYYTLHKIVHVNDDRAVEEYNKIYINVNDNSDIVDVRARAILANGKTVELNKSDIKDYKEKDGGTYKIFALEGLEKGCEIEYAYTVKRPTSFIGKENMQSDKPQLETSFELICPERLRFELKAFNFVWNATDSVQNGKRFVKCLQASTVGVEEEKYAFYEANVKYIEFKLSYNDVVRKGERLYTWNDLGNRIHGMYTSYSAKDLVLVSSIIKENGWDKLTDEAKKLIAVENYIKTKFGYNEDLDDDESNALSVIIKNKIAGQTGMMRLYSAIFQNLGIKYQHVLAGNRSSSTIDYKFENWNNCDYGLFFFPTQNKFIAPTRPDYRYPWIPPVWGNSNGVFFRTTTLGNVSTAIADVRNIELQHYSKSVHTIESTIQLNKKLDSLEIDAKQSYTGYAAVDMRDAFNYANDEDRQNIIKQLSKMLTSSENVLFSKVTNQEFEKATNNEPVVLHVKTKSGDLIEATGNKLLIKIGLAIGPQVEMYQEKERQFPMNIEYAHILDRKINLVIPDGYAVKNLNDLKLNEIYKDKGEQTMGFMSDYQLNGNVLTINVVEDYRNTHYPISQYEAFRKIINSASDFNKVVLVLEKK
ncbi:DUF3857 domain-containing protein [Pedobacter frigiditerrae]|uniref:DUF3857 domain-containing protein n=1 Tax=Pedobacter frigiditerrae TaxID=2530452 RepID=A0A4R0MQA5_9SPHI|nr:DUF3857 domain-containing protein [Pedobacter frigiditerrae]TCC89061.1 DUF3857 domain-containing protein [Pedobacter frigiditerrae]